MLVETKEDNDHLYYRLVRDTFVMKGDELFNQIQSRFLSPLDIILQPQPVADMIRESFWGGSMDHLSFINIAIAVYNVY
jgi:hypothetical protein